MSHIRRKEFNRSISSLLIGVIAVVFLLPIGFVVMNSFKGKLFISSEPFSLPSAAEGILVGFDNYISGIEKTGFPFFTFSRKLIPYFISR